VTERFLGARGLLGALIRLAVVQVLAVSIGLALGYSSVESLDAPNWVAQITVLGEVAFWWLMSVPITIYLVMTISRETELIGKENFLAPGVGPFDNQLLNRIVSVSLLLASIAFAAWISSALDAMVVTNALVNPLPANLQNEIDLAMRYINWSLVALCAFTFGILQVVVNGGASLKSSRPSATRVGLSHSRSS
jgi:hypothetical protein